MSHDDDNVLVPRRLLVPVDEQALFLEPHGTLPPFAPPAKHRAHLPHGKVPNGAEEGELGEEPEEDKGGEGEGGVEEATEAARETVGPSVVTVVSVPRRGVGTRDTRVGGSVGGVDQLVNLRVVFGGEAVGTVGLFLRVFVAVGRSTVVRRGSAVVARGCEAEDVGEPADERRGSTSVGVTVRRAVVVGSLVSVLVLEFLLVLVLVDFAAGATVPARAFDVFVFV